MPFGSLGKPDFIHTESGLPLAHAGVVPAGTAFAPSPASAPPTWGFDEDDDEQLAAKRRSLAFSAKGKERARSWWSGVKDLATGKRKPPEGERTCYLNDEKANAQFKFCSNYVSTTKYNLVTFLPKFLFGAYGGGPR